MRHPLRIEHTDVANGAPHIAGGVDDIAAVAGRQHGPSVFTPAGMTREVVLVLPVQRVSDVVVHVLPPAVQRLSRKLWDFDVDKKAIEIGRPQADHFAGSTPYPHDDRIVVLYAPTWEGDRPAALYGSVASHGTRALKF